MNKAVPTLFFLFLLSHLLSQLYCSGFCIVVYFIWYYTSKLWLACRLLLNFSSGFNRDGRMPIWSIKNPLREQFTPILATSLVWSMVWISIAKRKKDEPESFCSTPWKSLYARQIQQLSFSNGAMQMSLLNYVGTTLSMESPLIHAGKHLALPVHGWQTLKLASAAKYGFHVMFRISVLDTVQCCRTYASNFSEPFQFVCLQVSHAVFSWTMHVYCGGICLHSLVHAGPWMTWSIQVLVLLRKHWSWWEKKKQHQTGFVINAQRMNDELYTHTGSCCQHIERAPASQHSKKKSW